MKKLFSYLLLLLFTAALFGFSVPKAYARVGSITLDPLNYLGGGLYSASGSWDVQGNQCWVPAQGGDPGRFHYKIEIVDITAGGAPLTTINPAPCNGTYIGPVADGDRGTGGTWPAIGQPEDPFEIVSGHTICALLIHANENGNDKAKDAACTQATPAAPHLVVFKHVVNDNGGTNVASDFTMNVTGTNVSNSSFAGSETGVDITLDPGSFSVSETGPSGYSESDTADCTGTIAAEETKTCTITNDDIQPTLTLVKTVVNDNGGTKQVADFPLFVDTTGVTSGVTHGFDAGTYTASETEQYGYAASVWGGDCAEDGTATLAVGDTKTCTITNDDIQPKLTVTKVVVNDNGGTKQVNDFPLFVGSTGVTSGVKTGFNAGTYAITETGDTGYKATYSEDCDATGHITLNVGDVASCTITNDDIAPQLTVIKHVIKTDGSYVTSVASDFTMIISGSVTPAGNITFPGSETGVTTILPMIGSFTVTETGPGGYKKTYSGDCSGSIGLGQTKTCTITNTALPGRMTGGGSVFSSGVRITHGFTLHCGAITVPNNLEINWNNKSGKSQKFHLNSLTSAACSMTTGGNPAPPPNTANGFNKFVGTGIGTLNGKPGATIAFTFIDNGEPGKNDTARYLIMNGTSTVLTTSSVDLKLTQGNHQAHLY